MIKAIKRAGKEERAILDFMEGHLSVTLWDDISDGAWFACHEEAAREAMKELQYTGRKDDNDFAFDYIKYRSKSEA